MVRTEGRKPYNILKSTQLGSVKQSQLSNIQKGTFIEQEKGIQNNWKEQIEIKNAQLATKTFGYGLPGPHAFAISSTNADSSQTILKPSADEVYLINALSVSESAGATAAGALNITDGVNSVTIFQDATIAANQVDVVTWSGELYLTEGNYLSLAIASGAVTVAVAYSKVVY